MWHLAKVDLKITPKGSVDPTTLKVYAINTSTPEGCLNRLSKFLSQIRFPETDGEAVWVQASYSSYP